ncbi:CHAT domain-containing protein [Pelagicoccus enzymogenes]|uniref:CHAT domain-containing tetratricopeptide repeat protein n=1 Tax=Pelagicoccus enzymogenes TaxID=2773457 RepID=UPI00280EA132|nr:CHAT domain-containing protein [Pelagicoccus enzymogenes]MDQ8199054.1 CHAT domain-containing protein [Pelagicoccus enzymogenes]
MKPFVCLLILISVSSYASESQLDLSVAFEESFEDNQFNWAGIKAGSNYTAEFQQGALVWQNRRNEGFQSTLRNLPLSQRRNWEIALEARLFGEQGTDSPQYGFRWAGSTAIESYHSFVIGPKGYRIFTRYEGDETTLASGPLDNIYRARGNNSLSLRKLGSKTAYFVNGICIHIDDTLPHNNAQFGLQIQAQSTIAFDTLRISYLRADSSVFEEHLAAYRAALGDPTQSFFAAAAADRSELAEPLVVSKDPVGNDVIQTWLTEAFSLSEQKQHAQAATKFREILSHAPQHGMAHVQYAWCCLMLGEIETARRHADYAKLFEPIEVASHAIDAYVHLAEGNLQAARAALILSFDLDASDDLIGYIQTDIDDLIAKKIGGNNAATLKVEATTFSQNRNRSIVAARQAMDQALNAFRENEYEKARSLFAEAESKITSLPDNYGWVAGVMLTSIGSTLVFSDDFRTGQPYLEKALTTVRKNRPKVGAYVSDVLASSLADLYSKRGDQDAAFEVAISQLPDTLTLPSIVNSRKTFLLDTICGNASHRLDYPALKQYAPQLLKLALEDNSQYQEANAINYLGLAFAGSPLPPDKKTALQHFEKTLKIAQSNGFHPLADSAQANLALLHYQLGDKPQAKQSYADLIQGALERGDKLAAETYLNNKAALHMLDKEWDLATDAFQKAVEIVEEYRDYYNGIERIRFLEMRSSAYLFLAKCLALAKRPAALFKAQNSVRARVLAETLNSEKIEERVSLAAFQASLAPDEAALFYTQTSSCEFVINVVTQTSATPLLSRNFKPFVTLKAKYLDQMRRNVDGYKPVGQKQVGSDGNTYIDRTEETLVSLEDFDSLVEMCRGLIDKSVKADPALRNQVVKESLQAFEELLIQPALPHIAGKKKLLLFPDQILYFMPFDAMPYSNGKYLSEAFEIRYCQSADVREILRRRHYSPQRKSFFAMGGALYGEMSEKADRIDSPTRHIELKALADRNAQANLPQRDVYAALFGNKAMSYLQGTLLEVNNLSLLFQDATIHLGLEMTESRIKQLSQSGELANYKVVHLATHGFVLPEIPQLSGIAMCIFPEMRDGQDGYLTSPEIAQLNMQADLAVLSACQTGLGRLYGGEGVAGLTSSLLIGGANQALVTLWPVDDAGTMNFMTGLYTLTETQKMSYAEAATEMKRRFIRGDFGERFQDPHIWAPFVLYGP